MRTGNGRNGVVRAHGVAAGVLALGSCVGGVLGQENSAQSLPITEVTAFKDGHALVVRSGTVRTDGAGDVVLGELPRPLLGTFWASDLEERAALRAVTAQVVEETETVEPTSVSDLLTRNVGATIEFLDQTNGQRRGVLRRVLEENGQRLALVEESVSSGEGEPYTRTAAVPIEQVRDLRFVGDRVTTTMQRPVQRPRLTMDLDWEGAPEDEAGVSLMGVEHGLRWIPAYRVTILEDDRVRIELEATLVNDLADLVDARVHLAVGVPSFAFAGHTDPMALVEQLAPLGQAYAPKRSMGRGMSAGTMLSNSIMTQASYGFDDAGASAAGGGSPEVGGGERAEDLYVFTIEHVSLDHGSRVVVPLATYEAPYETVYTLDLIAGPPVQALQNFNTSMQRELALSLERPGAKHVLRITNTNDTGMPITTAPALIVKGGRTLAQGLLKYASAGARADLEVGAAVDLSVTTEETEAGREANALTWGSNRFGRIDIGFLGCVTNRKDHPVTVEVTKLALGQSDSVGAGGEASGVSLFSESAFWSGSSWWQSYSWPWWWHGVNGATKYTWTLEIEPGESAEFDASWHYFWN